MKTPIPGTEWLRIKTTQGNIFYSHKGRKESVWTVPEELKDALAALEQKEEEERQTRVKAEEEKRAEEARELERVKAAVKESAGKRKAEAVPVEEVVISKKAKVEEGDSEDSGEDEDDEDEDDSEEEEWQKEAAAQLAAEAEEEKKRQEEEKKRLEEEEKANAAAEAEAQKNKPLNMPSRVDLSIDEAKALFKVPFLDSLRAKPYPHICRLCSGKKTSTLCTLGIPPYPSSFQTHATSSFHPCLRVKKPLTNTVVIVHASSDNPKSRRIKTHFPPRKNTTNYFTTKSRVRAPVGQSFVVNGRRTADSTAGAKTIANVRKDSATILRSLVKVRGFSLDHVSWRGCTAKC